MEKQIGKLRDELTELRKDAVEAHLAGDKTKADCLTGKAVGMHSILDLAERVVRHNDREAVGELEGVERAILALGTIPRCN